MVITIGTRASDLAKQQGQSVIDQLHEILDVRAELTTTQSLGDKKRDKAIPEIGETGVFTSTLDKAVTSGDIDVAVHSLKDLPTQRNQPITIAAVPPRTTPMDAIIGISEPDVEEIPQESVIGTSSVRRKANLLYRNDAVDIEQCRGNVPSRIEKLNDDDSHYDGIILAMAGLERLEITEKPLRMIRPEEILPAPGQGALAVVCHSDNQELIDQLQSINHPDSRKTVMAERTFLSEVEGGCQAPVGALAKFSGDDIVLMGTVTHPNGEKQIGGELHGPADEAKQVGRDLARTLLERGAGEFIYS